MPQNNFYRAFEERYYAPRETIKQLRRVYLPFVGPLKDIYQEGQIYDIGCGRGEWLELMAEMGWEVYGVDLDDGMLRDCYERGLPVSKGDGVAFLQSLPDESQVVVSAFHVVEHIPFDRLQILVQESLRVLKPGGLLILETPNPENIRVGTSNFYLDPTHAKPIPFQLLSFLTEYYGFARTKVLRLQESSNLAEPNEIQLINVLTGVSPDYAVVAQKKVLVAQLARFDVLFGKECGLTLEALSSRFEERLNHRFSEIEAKVQHAENSAQQAEIALTAIHNSTSWRITAPLRMVGANVKKAFRLSNAIYSAPKGKAKLVVMHARLYINRRPKLKRTILAILRTFSIFKQRSKLSSSTRGQLPKALLALPPQARRVYAEIKSAKEQQRKKRV